ncbi:serine/threonine-protein kinase [Nocardia sp. CA-107356]|uniref:serine/threonine-protein kinase n=1 Tax=Nocardia sp. CA-107356 TaxID=3239972 RepID=UPI003D89F2E4
MGQQGFVAGEVFAGHRIERLLGSGGSGEVYLATDLGLGRRVALKVLTPTVSGDSDVRRRFEREAELLAQLEHPNIVTVYTRGTERGRLWLSMRYVHGVDLATELHAGAMPTERAVRIITEAAAALDHAHHAGVLHRDVKPANIMLTIPGDHARLVDFGIAKSIDDLTGPTHTGEVLASFHYVAPERFDPNAQVDRRADVYSLGCMLYQMLTGTPPYSGQDVLQLMNGHLNITIPQPSTTNPTLPAALDTIIAKALAKHPNDRYDTCTDLATAAATALTHHDTTNTPPTDTPKTGSISDLVDGIFNCLFGVGCLVVFNWIYNRAGHHADINSGIPLVVGFISIFSGLYNITVWIDKRQSSQRRDDRPQ